MPEQSPTLRDMIQEELDHGLTYRQLAARAVDPETGEQASYSLFNNIVLGKTDRMPQAYHLRAIATALRAPYERVRQAAITQWVPPHAGDQDAESNVDSRITELLERAEDLMRQARQLKHDEEHHRRSA